MHKTNIQRCFAFAIDALVVGIITSLIESFIPTEFKTSILVIQEVRLSPEISLFVYVIYFISMDVLVEGTTIGKVIFSLKVVDEEELPLNSKQLVVRSLLKVVSIIILPLALIYLIFKGTTLHDVVLNTKTIKT